MATHEHRIPLSIDYVEISVTDLAAAQAFYGEAFGWQFTPYGDEYAGIRTSAEADGRRSRRADPRRRGREGRAARAALQRRPRCHAAAVTAAGGTVVNGPYEFPGGRRFHFTDPSGNELGVWAER